MLVESLNQYYGGSHILRDVSFELPAGKVTALLGRNGVGKTTLLKTLMGLVPARSGKIVFQNKEITSASPHLRARAGLGYVPQGREIFSRLTVEENLLMGAPKIPDQIFAMFPVLKSMLGRRGGDLSGGQQQQLAIGRALAMKPSLLILDEPTEGIQPSIIKEIERAIRTLAARRDGDPAGRAVLRLRALARRPVPRDGARRDRKERSWQGHGARRSASALLAV
jgi:urea transport system ATP-binding protein